MSRPRPRGGATDPSELFNLRALLVAALVVVVGAIVGVAGFAYEQVHATWHPHVSRTAKGWRVRQPDGDIDDPALAGDHLVWQNGPNTIALDLSSGKGRLIGVAQDAQSVMPPVVSSAAASWLEFTGDARQQTLLYLYDFSSHRRRLLLSTAAGLDPPAVGPDAVYWLRGQGDATAVVSCDIGSGRRGILTTGSGLGPFLMADGSLVAWSHQDAPGSAFTLTVRNLAPARRPTSTCPGRVRARSSTRRSSPSGTLAWLRRSQDGFATITTYDLEHAGRTRGRRAAAPSSGPGSTARPSCGPSRRALEPATTSWACASRAARPFVSPT